MTALRKVMKLAFESWKVTESEKVLACVLAMNLEQFKVERVTTVMPRQSVTGSYTEKVH
jgi:hypothetical protein